MWLALTFLQLKYTIIQLQEWRNVKLLQSDFTENTKRMEDSIGGRGEGELSKQIIDMSARVCTEAQAQ